MADAIIQIITALVATFFFAVMFNIKGRKLIFASFGGMLAWISFLIVNYFSKSEFISCFFAAVVFSVYAEIMARILKTPTTTFIIPAFIPLVPGSYLYYALKAAMARDISLFLEKAYSTLGVVVSLSAGILLVNIIARNIKITGTKKEDK
jgi:uncharacterized membrane protein YjjB (DUF3815 family)